MAQKSKIGPCTIKRALISVYDKTGIVDFARVLVEEFGIEILSTGGTAKLLTDHSIPVTLVEEVTGFGEMLDGRVKTLHPKIHAAILADRDNPEHLGQLADAGIEPIDMVVVNLYPFERTVADPDCTFDQAIEMIDIGGPCLLRAAAKNHKQVLVVPSRLSLASVLDFLQDRDPAAESDLRARAAQWAFDELACYNASIAGYLSKTHGLPSVDFETRFDGTRTIRLTCLADQRYGENPHQSAALYRCTKPKAASGEPKLADHWETLSGEPMSFNNYADADAGLDLCKELARACGEAEGKRHCVFIKHTNPCGVGVGSDGVAAYRRAYLGDPNAAMGGILGCDFEIDRGFAETVMGSLATWGKSAGAGAFFVEVWVAPSFGEGAAETVRSMKKWGRRVRLLAVGEMRARPDPGDCDYRAISGGMLIQTRDLLGICRGSWSIVTSRKPTDPEATDLELAWLVCKHTKSNAISICQDGMLIGNGAGQMSRVMSCRIATWLAKENGHADKLAGSVAASDAFFPFRDGPDILMDAGVTAIIQPGGSKRDEETIAACNERGVAMVFTGTRHFRH